jgi:osmotically-inducible protein OsmY
MATKKVLALMAAVGCSLLAGGIVWADASTVPPQTGSDARITTEVLAKIQRDFPNWAGRIQVTTQNGVVTLSGDAATSAGELKVIEDAHAVTGVTRVRNEMQLVG